jgi:hypothetical protein
MKKNLSRSQSHAVLKPLDAAQLLSVVGGQLVIITPPAPPPNIIQHPPDLIIDPDPPSSL